MTLSDKIHRFSQGHFHGKIFRVGLLILLLVFSVLSFVGHAEAHAALEQTTPSANSRMDVSPPSIEIVFNEKLDKGGAKLLVLNESSRNVAKGKPESFKEGKGLRIALPKLGEGYYTVSYSVISADGHPVSGAYVFTVGNPAPLPDASQLDPHQQVGHSHDHGGAGLSQQSFLLYASRIMYYAGLLVVAGLALWSLHRQSTSVVREMRNQSLAIAGKFALIATMAYVFFSLQDLGQGEPLSEWGRILTETTIGKLYIAELLLALAAPLLPSLGLAARLFWAVAALFVEAWSGHAAAFNPIAYTIGLDFAHLAAASLWSAGLVLLLAIWYKERPEAGRFALLFSKWALISFMVLWVTGVLSTLDFLPSLEYLFYTAWGKWLIAKAAISLLVAITAFMIRLRLKKGDLPHGSLLKIDVGLLAAIVLSVGVLTYQTPLPANKELNFHRMGTEMHVTLRVTPNTPGDNQFTLKIWLPESIGKGVPKTVQLRLLPLDKEGMGFIDVPIKEYTDEEMDAFPDYKKSTYSAEGPYLPFAGQWKAQIRVTDSEDNEKVVETTYRIY
ncbi:copper resistance CopC/CopD family protein [Cohnella silvisoli]|uniref:Copper resistance protein CopC n=1 Tax=Cohnella silvisoli TaxID=2873699 RepID=A0ABV1KXG0_9BACL|nr:copper resistance protein CopC [Cohnella silvisoli]MCD9024184.1 copper resistance protein CopC/CopD [Cohnella silvisoli]